MDKQKTSYLAVAIALAILVIMPLFVENKYFNITQAKVHMLTLICVLGWALIFFACLQSKGRCLLKCKVIGLDALFLAGAAIAFISCCCSGNFKATFWGLYGWGIGGFLLISFAGLYFFLSRNLKITWAVCKPVVIVACFVALLTLLHSMGMDPLGLHTGIAEKQYYDFKSTLGNLNAHVGFVCLLFPVGLVVFANEEKEKRLPLELLFMIAMLVEIVFGCTDSVYLGVGLCAFLAIPYLCGTVQRLRRVCILAAIYGMLLLCSGSLTCFSSNAATHSGLTKSVGSPYVTIPVIVLGISGYVMLRKWTSLLKKKGTRRTVVIVLESCLFLVALYYLLDTAQHFSDSWGTGRGNIWRVSLACFQDLPFPKKLFGIGPEMQQIVLGNVLAKTLPVYTCHSETIQVLLTMGITGLGVWAAIYGVAINNMLRKKIWEKDQIVFALPVIAYLGQSLVCSAMATNVGILCVVWACYRQSCFCTSGEMNQMLYGHTLHTKKGRRKRK